MNSPRILFTYVLSGFSCTWWDQERMLWAITEADNYSRFIQSTIWIKPWKKKRSQIAWLGEIYFTTTSVCCYMLLL